MWPLGVVAIQEVRVRSCCQCVLHQMASAALQ